MVSEEDYSRYLDMFDDKSQAKKALKELEALGKRGDEEAYRLIADYYLYYKDPGRLSEFIEEYRIDSKVPREAESALKKAMALGSAEAAYELAFQYSLASDRKRQEGVVILMDMARQGDQTAVENLKKYYNIDYP